jgi:glycosyltransferase involved in cell wall biosynthesis
MPQPSRPLNILHVMRAPLGGLLRHVLDLGRGQIERGHRVGLVADRQEVSALSEASLAALAPDLALGLVRIPMSRQIGWADVAATRAIGEVIRRSRADVVHGHGAKGGAYARLAAPRHRAIRVYTPHGGSLHYPPGTFENWLYVRLERLLNSRADLFLFECEFIERTYRAKIGTPYGLTAVVRNGLAPGEFREILPGADASDVLFIGELRALKGVDLLLDALGHLRRAGRPLTTAIVGTGPDRDALGRQAERLGLGDHLRFLAPRPAREAFSLGRLLVVPSRAESLPYIVLEAAAAGVPMIATCVGGIPEIFGPQAGRLIPANDNAALAAAIARALDEPDDMRAAARILRERVRSAFALEGMVNAALSAYGDALEISKYRTSQ